MLLKPILSIFVAIQILIWRHAAQGQPNQQGERTDEESVNPPDNPVDCEEECQCEDEDDEEECQCGAEDDIRNRCVRGKKYCPVLEVPNHVISEGSCRKANPGDKCSFKCRENVTLEGRDKIFCRSNLEWSDVVPLCKEKKYCPMLQIPINVFSEGSCSKANPEDECRFKCKENFTLEGRDKIFCRSNLQWSDAVPHCKEIKYCPELNIPDNVISEGYCRKAKPGNICRFKCKEKFTLEGGENIICLSGLEWNAAVPQCKDSARCEEPDPLKNSYYRGSCRGKGKEGDWCQVVCNGGYKLDGESMMTCTKDVNTRTLIWKNNGKRPQCIKEDEPSTSEKPDEPSTSEEPNSNYCRKPRPIYKNSFYRGFCNGKTKEGQWCKVICNDGYKQVGDAIIYCKKNVKTGFLGWSFNKTKPPKCIKGKLEFCQELQRPENAEWDDGCDHATRGYVCLFLCNKGYLLEGKAMVTCSSSLKWDGVPPRCVKRG